jgi:hypothetical protein
MMKLDKDGSIAALSAPDGRTVRYARGGVGSIGDQRMVAPRWRVPRAPTALEVVAAQSQGRWPTWDKASGGARLMAALCSTPR